MFTKTTITINPKKPWEVGRGHSPHRSGAGAHTPKPHKGHRGKKHREAIREQF